MTSCNVRDLVSALTLFIFTLINKRLSSQNHRTLSYCRNLIFCTIHANLKNFLQLIFSTKSLLYPFKGFIKIIRSLSHKNYSKKVFDELKWWSVGTTGMSPCSTRRMGTATPWPFPSTSLMTMTRSTWLTATPTRTGNSYFTSMHYFNVTFDQGVTIFCKGFVTGILALLF